MSSVEILHEIMNNPVAGSLVSIVKMQMVKESVQLYEKKVFTSPYDVVDFVSSHFERADREMVAVISLDGKSAPITFEIITVGTVNSCMLSPREVFKHALLSNAFGVLLVHNQANPKRPRKIYQLQSG